jgi:hypothetical protein
MAKRIGKRDDLAPDPRNANRGTERGRYMLEQSLRECGAGRSILADKEGRIIAGNKTLEVAEALDIPVRVVETDGHELVVVQRSDLDLDSEQARKLAYYDNRASEVGLDWDASQIAADLETGLDLSSMFRESELAAVLKTVAGDPTINPPEPDPQAELQTKWNTALGQLWEVPSKTSAGIHRLLCGDSTRPNEVVQLGALPPNLFFDPPWDAGFGVPSGQWRGVLAFTDGRRAGDIVRLLGAPTWVFIWDCGSCWWTRNRPLQRSKGAWWYGKLKDFDQQGSFYGEPGKACSGSNSRGEFDYIPDARGKLLADVFSASLPQLHSEGASHEKPLDWIRLLIGDCFRGDVYDPFMGSGVSIMACEQLGRVGYGVELDPAMMALTLERFALAGLEPRLTEATH